MQKCPGAGSASRFQAPLGVSSVHALGTFCAQVKDMLTLSGEPIMLSDLIVLWVWCLGIMNESIL